jgi:hypothetical protein
VIYTPIILFLSLRYGLLAYALTSKNDTMWKYKKKYSLSSNRALHKKEKNFLQISLILDTKKRI